MIRQLKEIREDGLVITESMGLKEIGELGPTSRTVAAEWFGDAGLVRLENPNGLWVQVLPRRDAIAVSEAEDSSCGETSLRVLNEDGTERFKVFKYQCIHGVDHVGTFVWFEKPRSGRPNCFSVAYDSRSSGTMYQLDIDGSTGDIINAYPTR